MDDAQQARIAENEALSRYANETIEEAHAPDEKRSPGAFLCECSHPQCAHVIEITPGDYERVRAHPRRFIVHPGHETIEVERIVDAQGGYLVVEKEDEAGRVAESEDPRG